MYNQSEQMLGPVSEVHPGEGILEAVGFTATEVNFLKGQCHS